MSKLPNKRIRRKKIGVPKRQSEFTEQMLFSAANDLTTGRLKLERLRFSDDMVVGLRAKVERSGLITLHATYEIGEARPMILLGSLNKGSKNHITIEQARRRTEVIKELAMRGIDVQDGLHARLMREIDKKGVAWLPE